MPTAKNNAETVCDDSTKIAGFLKLDILSFHYYIPVHAIYSNNTISFIYKLIL